MEEGNIANIKLYGKWGDNIPLADTPEEAIKIILGNINGKIGMELDYVNVTRYREMGKKIQPEIIVSISELVDMEKAMASLGIPDATERIYRTILEICK